MGDNRRCFRKIGDNLIEKDVASVKKDLTVEIANIKQTLDVVYRTMIQQEKILDEYEQKYNNIINVSSNKSDKNDKMEIEKDT